MKKNKPKCIKTLQKPLLKLIFAAFFLKRKSQRYFRLKLVIEKALESSTDGKLALDAFPIIKLMSLKRGRIVIRPYDK